MTHAKPTNGYRVNHAKINLSEGSFKNDLLTCETESPSARILMSKGKTV